MTDDARDLVRQQFFECDGPVDVDVELGSGSIEVRFSDDTEPGTARAGTPAAGGQGRSGEDGPTAGSASGDAPAAGGAGEGAGWTDHGTAGEGAGGTAEWAGPPADTSADAAAETSAGASAEGTADRAEAPADTATDATTGEARDDGTVAGEGTSEGAATFADDTGVFTDEATAAAGDRWAGANGQPAIMVEVRYEPRSGSNWGLAGLLDWVGREFGAPTSDLAAEAVRQTTVSAHGNRLTIRGPRAMPLRGVPLAITVHAPTRSSLHAKAGSADVRLGGTADRVDVATGSGDVSVDRADGPAQVKTGSGTVRLGPVHEGLATRTGSGDVEVTSLEGDASLVSGSGNIWIGTLRGGQVTVKTGSGDLTVAEAAEGLLQLVSGSGDLRVGIRQGVLAEVDVASGSGRAHTDLPMSTAPPSREARAAVRVRARTGSGDAVVGRATA